MARILLIEDDKYVRNVIRLTLEHFGHTVTEARNGQEGIDQFMFVKTDLVITDLVMPVKGGFEVMSELKKHHPTVKIIVISGGGRRGPQDYLQLANALGATRVLAKPFAPGILMTMVNEVLADPNADTATLVRPPERDLAHFVNVAPDDSAVTATVSAGLRPWGQKLKEA